MSVAVIVPRSPGSCSHRDRAWEWLERRWGALHPTWQTVEGTAPHDRWCKAEAVADALTRTDAGVLVICDADLVVDPATLARSVDAVQIAGGWAVPYHRVFRLNPAATADALEADPTGPLDLPTDRRNLARVPYSSRPGGGVFVVTRSAYLAAGGFDPRFVGWGGEDISIGLALRTLAGPHTRIRGDLFHLWHPTQPDRRPGSRGNHAALERRYRAANDDPAAMRALIEERATWPNQLTA